MENIKRKIISLVYDANQLSEEQIAQYLNLYLEEDREELRDYLLELEEEKVLSLADNLYRISLDKETVVGIFKGSDKGFGFVENLDGSREEFYVYHLNLKGALDGDLVLGKITRKKKNDKKAEVKITEILEDGKAKYLGTFYDNGTNGFVMLDNKKIPEPIFISEKRRGEAQDEDKVFIELCTRGKKNKGPSGEVVEILGNKNQVGMDIVTIARMRDIDMEFSKEALDEATNIPEVVSEEEIKKRKDLREEVVITIDGADSKDLDDAISIEKLANGNFKLGVHIADVAHYVREGTPLDQDAVGRATSVYLVDRVIPMLPTKLSNGVCSLNPHVDRLTLSCIMEVNPQGKVVSHEVVESVINSKERMTYDDVKKIVEKEDEELLEKYAHIDGLLQTMKELAVVLMKKREQRGAIDFDFPEAKVLLDENNHPVQIKKYDRNIATRIIEEFMILANETVSEHFTNLDLPFVYRVHETPDPERIAKFKNFIQLFGYSLLGEDPTPKELQNLLNEVKGKKEEFAIQQIMLRSLKKAKYSPNNVGHYGLASEFYSHFTSPIRRYPDLQIHRIIKEFLHKKINGNRLEELGLIVKTNSNHSSKQELKAQEAERESVLLKKAEYMKEKIGEEYEGMVTGVTEYGLYVQLDNTIEGLIHISKLKDDYYVFDEYSFSLIGERTAKRFTLGDTLKVKVSHVNTEKKEIDFLLVEEASSNEEEDVL